MNDSSLILPPENSPFFIRDFIKKDEEYSLFKINGIDFKRIIVWGSVNSSSNTTRIKTFSSCAIAAS